MPLVLSPFLWLLWSAVARLPRIVYDEVINVRQNYEFSFIKRKKPAEGSAVELSEPAAAEPMVEHIPWDAAPPPPFEEVVAADLAYAAPPAPALAYAAPPATTLAYAAPPAAGAATSQAEVRMAFPARLPAVLVVPPEKSGHRFASSSSSGPASGSPVHSEPDSPGMQTPQEPGPSESTQDRDDASDANNVAQDNVEPVLAEASMHAPVASSSSGHDDQNEQHPDDVAKESIAPGIPGVFPIQAATSSAEDADAEHLPFSAAHPVPGSHLDHDGSVQVWQAVAAQHPEPAEDAQASTSEQVSEDATGAEASPVLEGASSDAKEEME
jgi:hypothetical protein